MGAVSTRCRSFLRSTFRIRLRWAGLGPTIAANSLSIARADRASSVSFRWIVSMFRRKSYKALPDHCTLILFLQRGCGIVRHIFDRGCCLFVQLLLPSTSERRYGLEARDRQQPCRYRRAPFKPASLTPHVEKYLATTSSSTPIRLPGSCARAASGHAVMDSRLHSCEQTRFSAAEREMQAETFPHPSHQANGTMTISTCSPMALLSAAS
jgi:hypothetical protein